MSRAILSIVVAAMFVAASVAQHTSGGAGGGGGSSAGSSGGGGGHSSGGGGSSSVGSSSSGGSHSSGGSSGGGHSSGGSSGGHSSNGSAAHVSGGSGRHISSANGECWSFTGHGVISPGGVAISPSASPHSTGISGIDERGRSFTLDHETSRHVNEMIRSGKSVDEIRDEIRDYIRNRPAATTTTVNSEKRGFLAALRHPFHHPEPNYSIDLRHRICLSGSCKVCPAGTTAGSNGACSGSKQIPHLCMSGSYWYGNSCMALAQQYRWNDCLEPADPELLAARRSMEVSRRQMTDACNQDAASQACADMNFAYQQAVGRYNVQRNIHQRLRLRCLQGSAFGYFDPIDPIDPMSPQN